MGLLLIIPGLVFLLNGVTWFDGEDKVGAVLVGIGAVLLLVQLVIFAVAAAKVNKMRFGDFDRF